MLLQRMGGVPQTSKVFIPVDLHGRVTGMADVYSAGDITTFRSSRAALPPQQAEAAAEVIATVAGLEVTPGPFRPAGDDRGWRLNQPDPRRRRRRHSRQLGPQLSLRGGIFDRCAASGRRSRIRPVRQISGAASSARPAATTSATAAGSSTRSRCVDRDAASGRRAGHGRTVVAAGGDLLVFGGARWKPDGFDATLLDDAWIWSPPARPKALRSASHSRNQKRVQRACRLRQSEVLNLVLELVPI